MVNRLQLLCNQIIDPVLDVLSDGWHWLSRRLKPLRVGIERLRSRRPVSIGMAVVLVSGMIPIASFVGVTPAQGAWFNEDWQYRQSQLLTHASAEDNVYVDFSGANALDTSASGKFQADCGDIRFTDAAGNELPYYLASGCGTTTTVVHVLFSALPAGEQYIYIYYGNPSVGNGTTGFDFSTAATGVTFGSRGTEESTKGPVAEWKLSEGYGTTTKSSNSGQYTGTLTSGPTWQPQENCVSGKCLRFDGADDNVTISNATPLQITGDITIEAWVFPINNTLYQPIVSKNSSNEYEIAADFRTGADLATRWEGAQKNFSGFFNGYTNRWVHVAVTVSGSTISAYRNGALVGTTTGVSRTISTNNITIGKRTGGSFWFKGLIDEVKIYDYAITLSQLQWQYVADSQQLVKQGGNLQNGLVGYWKMDEASWSGVAGEVKDSSLAGRDLTSYNSAATKAGKYGYGADLSATTSYIGGTNTTIQATNAPRGYSFWIKPNSSQNWAYVWSLYITNNLGNIMYYGTSGGLHARICENNSQLSVTPVVGQWNHVAFTFDPVSMTEVSYLNGVKKETIDLSAVGCEAFPTAKSMYIGGYSTGANKFDGDMDEFREYSRALSYQDAQQLYSLGPSPLAQYDFEEASGSTFYDSSAHGLDGTSVNTQRADGKHGRGVTITPYAQIPIRSTANMPPLNITIGAWIKPNAFGGNVAGYDLSTYILGTTADYRIQARIDDGTSHVDKTSSVVFSAADIGTWHYIAMSYDGSKIKFYLDGTYVSETATSLIPLQTARSIAIGYCSVTYFDGDIDDVTFYNYARTQQQIVEDMNGGDSAAANPIAWYKMDEGNGTTVKNSGLAGSSLDATATQDSWTSGQYGQSLNFNTSNRVQLPVGSDLPIYNKVATGYTISFWVKGISNQFAYVYAESTSSGGVQNFILAAPNSASGKLLIYLRDDAGAYQILNVSSSQIVFDDTWHHVAWVDNNGKASLYVDGVRDRTNFNYSAGTAHTFDNATIGARYNPTADHMFTGKIDEFKMYNRALTQQEIVADYNRAGAINAGSSGSEVVTTGSGGTGTMPSNSKDSQYCVPGDTTSCAAPVGEWKFEEGGGTTVKDTSGGGNDGTWRNSLPSYGLGKIGHGGNFDGTNYAVSMGTKAALNNTSAFTIAAWVKINSTATSTSYRIAGTLYSGGTQGYVLQRNGPANSFLFNWGTGSGTSGLTSPDTITANRWYYLVGTYDGSAMRLYVDGRLHGTNSSPTFSTTGSQNFCIGGVDGLCSIARWNGGIDEVRYYNYARSAAQVAWEYNQGKPMAHYKMNECQGSILHSSTEPYVAALDATINLGASGQTTLGTCLSSGTAWGDGASGKSGGSIRFDGTDDKAVASGAMKCTLNQSVAAWVNGTAISGNDTIFEIEACGGRFLTYYNSSGKFVFYPHNNGAISTPKSYSFDTWHHVVFTTEQTSATEITAKIYVDNQLAGQGVLIFETPSSTAQQFSIGSVAGAGGNYFSGQVDDVQVFHYTLTPQLIASVYNGGSVRWNSSQ